MVSLKTLVMMLVAMILLMMVAMFLQKPMKNLQIGMHYLKINNDNQRAKKVVSDSPGLVDFAIGLVIFVLNLPDRQVLFFGEIQITEGL